jgi:phosphatidate cytidylyltransferase
MSNFTLRLIFGALYVAIMVAGAVLDHPWFSVLMAVLVFLSLNEMSKLAEKTSKQHQLVNPLLFGGIIVYAAFFGIREMGITEFAIAWILQIVALVVVYLQLKKNGKVEYIFATLYLWLPLAGLAFWFEQYPDNNTAYILFYLITIWLYDSMAYSVGKLIGKRPIFPKVSPKKTIEGTIGGTIITVTAMYWVNLYWFNLEANAMLLALVVVFFATFGDFVESFMKRKLGVKDSGDLIPGHGGILDRIDSILLSALPYLVILLVI